MKTVGMTRLFLTWACPECERIKRELTQQSIYEDNYTGSDRSRFVIIYTFNNAGARDVLDQYDLVEDFMPVLLLPDGRRLTNTDDIITHLNQRILAWHKRT